jgi:hypothetical protein
MSLKNLLLTTTGLSSVVGSAFLAVTPAAAVDDTAKPAVDGVNWKLDGLGGAFSDPSRSFGAGRVAVTVPLGTQFGLQLDGVAGNFDNRFFASGAGHLFWRDPDRGLLGLYGNYTSWDQYGGVHVSQVAGEGEIYWGRWTLQGVAGIESNNSATIITKTLSTVPLPNTPPGPNTINTLTQTIAGGSNFFDQVNLAYYVTDNWKAYVGHRYLGGENALALGTEFGIPTGRGTMTALFAEGRIGENGHNGIWGGLRVYFGAKDKPLMARHRQDDPTDWAPASLLSITNKYSSSSRSWTCPSGEILMGGSCI